MTRRLVQIVFIGALLLGMVSLAAAQQTPQPVVRLGNFIEVGNDLFMHIIATADMRYKTSHNADFEDQVRDRTLSRSPTSTSQHEQEGDLFYAELRFGVDFRYQKNLTFQLLFENQSVFDGSLIDDRANTSNPGGTSVFRNEGPGISTENPGFRVERFWVRYKFPGTPMLLHVGPDLWAVSQAGILGNDNPRIAIEGEFGALKVYASAVIERESQRLGLQNDNDAIYYVFGGLFDAKPHRFGFDVVYFRDRFAGADTSIEGFRALNLNGWTGQRHDSVWLNASWSGRLGPVRGLLQGNLLLGTARGGTVNVPAAVPAGRDYDIFAGSVVAYAEVDLGIVRPFVGFVFASGDGDPTDDELHGFSVQTVSDSTQVTSTGFFNHLDTSPTFALRDYSCPGLPGRAGSGLTAQPQGNTSPGRNLYEVGTAALAGSNAGTFECSHGTANVFNHRIGNPSHVGLVSEYSNPGTLVIPVGLRVFPVKGHELTGYYVYRAMVTTSLLEQAFATELAGRSIGKTQLHGIGGSWLWTLNPHFDIRLSGEIAVPGEGYRDIAELADCNGQPCDGNDPALRAEARFRARF